MVNKIVYMLSHPLTERDYRRFGIKNAVDNGNNVEVIDLFSLLYPRKDRGKLQLEFNTNLKIKYINTIFNLRKELNRYNDKDAAVLLYPPGLMFNLIVKILNNRSIPVVCVNAGTLPVLRSKKKGKDKNFIFRIFKMYSFREILSILVVRLFDLISYFFLKPKVTYFFYGGYKAFEIATKQLKNAQNLISLHAFDYDLFLGLEGLNKNIDDSLPKKINKYVVFIDQNLFNDPDMYLWGGDSIITDKVKEEYSRQLNNLFNEIEDKFNYEIVIAAHPRSDYSLDKGCYLGRKIIYGDTPNAIKNAEICILHSSTAINFAVLYKKPIIILEPDVMKDILLPGLLEFLDAMCEALNIKKLKTHPNIALDVKIPYVDEEIYADYINSYIKENNSHDDYFWNCVFRELNK